MADLENLKKRGLPDQCLVVDPCGGEIVVIKLGEDGYHKYNRRAADPEAEVKRMNKSCGATEAQSKAMLAGSMWGWDSPGSFPKACEKGPARAGTPLARKGRRARGALDRRKRKGK